MVSAGVVRGEGILKGGEKKDGMGACRYLLGRHNGDGVFLRYGYVVRLRLSLIALHRHAKLRALVVSIYSAPMQRCVKQKNSGVTICARAPVWSGTSLSLVP